MKKKWMMKLKNKIYQDKDKKLKNSRTNTDQIWYMKKIKEG